MVWWNVFKLAVVHWKLFTMSIALAQPNNSPYATKDASNINRIRQISLLNLLKGKIFFSLTETEQPDWHVSAEGWNTSLLRILRTYKYHMASNPVCQMWRKRIACLIPGPSQRVWVCPSSCHLSSLRLHSCVKEHHVPAQKLLPRFAVLYNNYRIHNIMAITGIGENGRI